MRSDLRYAFRGMRASPGFTAAAVLVLATGIGATVASFSVLNMVALRPLPVREPDTLVRFQRHAPARTATAVPYPAVAFYRDHTRTLTAVLAMTSAQVTVAAGEPLRTAFFVTANYFDELGPRSAHGRLFSTADDAPGAAPAVVLGYGYWISQFGSDPAVVGTSVRLNGKPATVIGVAAREFSGLGGDTPAFWTLLEFHEYFVHGSQVLTDFAGGVEMWGRLAPGATRRVVEEELALLAAELRTRYPKHVWDGERLLSAPGGYQTVAGALPMFALASVLAVLILAVACGNLGSLLLARGASRQREMTLRHAIGASHGRLIRQLLTESLVLAFLGGLGGLALGALVVRGLMVWTDAPLWLDPTPDWRVLLFAILTAGVSAALFGLAPALQIARQKQNRALGRSLLIGVQVASSCVLLIVAGLLTRAVERGASANPGFEYERVIVVEPSLAGHGYTAARARAYVEELREGLLGIAGVEAVSVTSTPPLGDLTITAVLQQEGRPLDVYIHQVDPGYLAAMKIPLRRGRNLTVGDDASIVVSESLARQRWPGRDPLGEVVTIGDEGLTVVGIAGDARSLAVRDPDAVELYRLAREADLPGLAVIARTAGPSAPLVSAVVAAAHRVDPRFTPQVQLLKDQFERSVRDLRMGALAASMLGVIALAVACLGVMGLVAYSVAQRTKDIGIRLALGASSRHILRTLSREFLGTVTWGMVLGVLAAAGLSQLLRRELYGLSTIDPLAYLGAILLFAAAVSLAALLPARRALRADPLTALRCE